MRKLGETGGDSADAIREAKAIFSMGIMDHYEEMSGWAKDFVTNIQTQINDPAGPTAPSPSQLFRLRDIKDRYL